MKIIILLLALIKILLLPVEQTPPPTTVQDITKEKTEFSSPMEWVNEQNKLLAELSKIQNSPDLTMKIVKREVRDGTTFLTLSVPHDVTDNHGRTIYRDGLIIVFIKDGHLYIISEK